MIKVLAMTNEALHLVVAVALDEQTKTPSALIVTDRKVFAVAALAELQHQDAEGMRRMTMLMAIGRATEVIEEPELKASDCVDPKTLGL